MHIVVSIDRHLSALALGGAVLPAAALNTAPTSEELAKTLANPIASLISVPFQLNFDDGYGPNGDGSRTLLNIQPVIPFCIGENWNVTSRTIPPEIDQDDVIGGTSQSGTGGIVQSFFFSPKQPT